MKDQLKKTFSDNSRYIPTKDDDHIKTEKALLADMNQLQIRPKNRFDTHNAIKFYSFRDPQENMYLKFMEKNDQHKNENETFFSRNSYLPRNQNIYRNHQYTP